MRVVRLIPDLISIRTESQYLSLVLNKTCKNIQKSWKMKRETEMSVEGILPAFSKLTFKFAKFYKLPVIIVIIYYKYFPGIVPEFFMFYKKN